MDGGEFCALLPSGGRQPGELVMAVSVPVEYGDEETPIDRAHGEVTVPDEASNPDRAPGACRSRGPDHRHGARARHGREPGPV
jgi:hypothetical protein